jgi:hypothetical protein
MIAATLHGPNYFSPNHDETTIEVFASIAEAIEALFERYSSNGKRSCTYNTLDGRRHSVLFPVFGEGTRFECYGIEGLVDRGIADEVQVMSTLAAVHSGVRDWTLTLEYVGEQISVTVVNS